MVNGDGEPDLLVANSDMVGLLLHTGSTATTTTLVPSLNPSTFG